MAKAGFLVCLVVIVAMDVAAGILGIEAEKAQNSVKYKRVYTLDQYCRYPNIGALRLGLAAVVLLTSSHVIATLFAACTCICLTEELEKSSTKRQASFACHVLSWFTVAAGFPALIIGTLANSKSKESCVVLNHHNLSVGGIFCFIHSLCCIAYYISATASI